MPNFRHAADARQLGDGTGTNVTGADDKCMTFPEGLSGKRGLMAERDLRRSGDRPPTQLRGRNYASSWRITRAGSTPVSFCSKP